MSLHTLRRRVDRLDCRPRQGRLTRAERAELRELERQWAAAVAAIDTDPESLIDLVRSEASARRHELRDRALPPAELAARAAMFREVDAMSEAAIDVFLTDRLGHPGKPQEHTDHAPD